LRKKGCAIQREKSGHEDVDDWAKVLARRRSIGERSVALVRREEKNGCEDVDDPS